MLLKKGIFLFFLLNLLACTTEAPKNEQTIFVSHFREVTTSVRLPYQHFIIDNEGEQAFFPIQKALPLLSDNLINARFQAAYSLNGQKDQLIPVPYYEASDAVTTENGYIGQLNFATPSKVLFEEDFLNKECFAIDISENKTSATFSETGVANWNDDNEILHLAEESVFRFNIDKKYVLELSSKQSQNLEVGIIDVFTQQQFPLYGSFASSEFQPIYFDFSNIGSLLSQNEFQVYLKMDSSENNFLAIVFLRLIEY